MKPRISELKVKGAMNLENYIFEDERGMFTALTRKQELPQELQDFVVENVYLSTNTKKGTLRGFHKQRKPFEERKILTCIRGKAFHVMMRPKSHTEYHEICVNYLDSSIFNSSYIPGDCYSAFLTLEDQTDMVYLTQGKYEPAHQEGINWQSDCFNEIVWPIKPLIISTKDKSLGYA